MSKDDLNSGWDDEENIFSLRYILAFLMRNSITTALVFLLLLPILNLLPEDLYNFTFDHPSLLLGPLLILVPVILAYFLNWGQIMAPENIAIVVGFVIFGLIYSMTIFAFGLMTALFICPDEFPITGLSNFGRVAKHTFRGDYVTVICYGESGTHEIPGNILARVTNAAFLLSGLLSAGVSFGFGRRSWLFGRKSDAGEFHFIRYFLIAMTLSMAFLSLPEYYSGANFLAGMYESSGEKRQFQSGRIARYSPIHGAVQSGDMARVKTLLKEGANVNAVVNNELTPLAIAVKRKNAQIVRMLVEAGAEINRGEKTKQSAMQLAFQGQNPELIAYLLKQGGNPLAVGKGGFGLLTTAVEKLDLEGARKLLEKGASSLLKEGANVNAVVNNELTPLAIAVKRKNAQIVRMLVEAGAEINRGEKTKQSAMQLAFQGQNPELIAYLLKQGGNPLAVGKGGFGLLTTAVEKLDLEGARKLLEKGASANILTKNEGQSLLFRTIFKVNTDYYRQPRVNQIRSLEMARLLLKHGANLEFKARYDETPLIFAIRMDNIWMVKLFLEHGADIGRSLLPALRGRSFREEILALLLEKGVKINRQDQNGRTALMVVTKDGRSPWPIQWLVDHGADINMVDKSGKTALDQLGRGYYDDKKRKVLIESGAKSALTR